MSNPAETLYSHFHALAALNPDSQSWPNGWKEVLGGIEWLDAVEPLLGLLSRMERIIAGHPELAPGALMYHKDEWQRAILLHRVNLDAAMNGSGFALTESSNFALYTLSMLIGKLPEVRPQVGKDQLTQLAEAVAALREDVVNSDELDADLRTFLLEQVTKMQSRIDLVRVTGSGPVEDLVAETIGSGAVRSSLWQRAMDTPLRDKILRVWLAFNTIVGAIDTTSSAIESAASHVEGAKMMIEKIFNDSPKAIEGPKGPAALPPASSERMTRGDPPPAR